ncbi:MAG: Fe-S cluster assembly protein SufD [Thermoanaerobaculia bacterium]
MTPAVENDILQRVRQEGAERFAALGWPTTRLESWRYTNLAPLAKVAWKSADSATQVQTPSPFAGRAVLELVFVNGHYAGRTGDAPIGVRNLAAAGSDALVERHLSQQATLDGNAMIALNASNMVDGAILEIPAGIVVEGFIHLLFIGSGDGIWSHPRNLIVLGRGAQAAVVESYVGTGAYFTNAVTEIVAGDGAVLDHYRVQQESLSAHHVGHTAIRQERSSSVTSRSIALGGSIARVETTVVLGGEGAAIALDGLFVGSGNQHLDNQTTIDHATPHCDSTELYKGVLDQNARGVFDGRIIVRPHAQKTASKQENRNLLLSESAIVDSKPTLEIHNDDVKCNHGSTIGQIDQEAFFYLRSRGIGADEARNLLVLAFASEIVDRMKIDAVAEQVRRALFQALPDRLPERRGSER